MVDKQATAKDVFPVKKDADKSRKELLKELELIRQTNLRLKNIVSRYEKLSSPKNEPVHAIDEEIEVQRELIDSLKRELSESHQEINTQNEELMAQNEELRVNVEELGESESRFKAIFDNAGMGLGIADMNGRILDSNPAFQEMLGYSQEELQKKRFIDITYPPDIDLNVELTRQMLTGQIDKYRLEKRYVRKDGCIIWCRLTASTIRYNNGAFKYILTVIDDITDRKRVEDALSESEASLARSQSIAHLGNWEVDVKTKRVSGSNELYRMFNLESDVTLDTYVEKFHPDERLRVVDSINAAIYGGKPYNIDYRIVPHPGIVRYIHAEGEVTIDEKGLPLKFFGTVQDITELKQAEDERLRLARDIELLLESTDEGIVQIDATGKCVLINRSASAILGYGRDELIGKPLHDLIHHTLPDGTPCTREKCDTIRALITGEGERVSDQRFFRKDGAAFPVEYSANPIKEQDGTIKGVVITFTDITERKQAEKELEDAKADSELYLDLMGHDIRNMNMIGMGFLELAIESTNIKNEEKEYLLKSLGSLENSTRLIDNVRKLRKARSSKPEHQEVDACQMLMRVLAHYSNLPGINVSFNYDIPTSCPARANELLYEVFENVVGNAIKHGGSGPVIGVKFDQFATDGRTYNRFLVEDNGPGIPDARKDRIFNRLQRGDSKADGTGLGLYLVRSLVESYDGRVSVEDRVPGDYTKGARFMVWLPAVDQ